MSFQITESKTNSLSFIPDRGGNVPSHRVPPFHPLFLRFDLSVQLPSKTTTTYLTSIPWYLYRCEWPPFTSSPPKNARKIWKCRKRKVRVNEKSWFREGVVGKGDHSKLNRKRNKRTFYFCQTVDWTERSRIEVQVWWNSNGK